MMLSASPAALIESPVKIFFFKSLSQLAQVANLLFWGGGGTDNLADRPIRINEVFRTHSCPSILMFIKSWDEETYV